MSRASKVSGPVWFLGPVSIHLRRTAELFHWFRLQIAYDGCVIDTHMEQRQRDSIGMHCLWLTECVVHLKKREKKTKQRSSCKTRTKHWFCWIPLGHRIQCLKLEPSWVNWDIWSPQLRGSNTNENAAPGWCQVEPRCSFKLLFLCHCNIMNYWP